MEIIDFQHINDWEITYQPDGTSHLFLKAINDMNASIAYSILANSTSVSLTYKLDNQNDYFNFRILLNNKEQFIEFNYSLNRKQKELASIIDKNLLTNLWVGYPHSESLQTYGMAIQVLR